MSEEEVAFNLFYLVILFGVIYPPQEFVSAGIFVRFQLNLNILNISIYRLHIREYLQKFPWI